MRAFRDEHDAVWVATVRARPGRDYKGRYYFFVRPEAGAEGEGIALLDVRWNSERTAQRTLTTMSEVELRRRLGSARGRGGLSVEAAETAL
jgi:hypothetical protein